MTDFEKWCEERAQTVLNKMPLPTRAAFITEIAKALREAAEKARPQAVIDEDAVRGLIHAAEAVLTYDPFVDMYKLARSAQPRLKVALEKAKSAARRNLVARIEDVWPEFKEWAGGNFRSASPNISSWEMTGAAKFNNWLLAELKRRLEEG